MKPNVEVVLKVYEALRTKNVDEIVKLSAPDIQIHQSKEVPWGGEYVGVDQAVQFFGAVTSFIDSHVTVEKMLDAGDYIAVTGHTAGTVKITGKSFDVALVHLWRINQGQVSSLSVFLDNVSILPALSIGD